MKKCPNCLNDFEPNSGKQKFCSDKCKVYFSRKKPKALPKNEKKETNTETKSFSEGGTILDQMNIDNKKEAWVKEIEKFCSDQGILPSELIEGYKSKKVPKKEYVSISEKTTFQQSNFMNDLRKKKCGY